MSCRGDNFAGTKVEVVEPRAAGRRGMSRAGVVPREVYFPSVASLMLSSLKVAAGFAFTGAIVGEFVVSSRGPGYLPGFAQSTYNTALSLALAGLIMVFVMAPLALAGALERRLTRWRS